MPGRWPKGSSPGACRNSSRPSGRSGSMLTRDESGTLTILFEGQPIKARMDESVASALLAVLSIGTAIYLVSVRVARDAENALQREILATRELVDDLRTRRTESFLDMARASVTLTTAIMTRNTKG